MMRGASSWCSCTLRVVLVAWATLMTPTATGEPIRFSVLMHLPSTGADSESTLRAGLESAQVRAPAFVVVNGLKNAKEACSDRLFRRRMSVVGVADTPVFLSMAGSDWIGCRDRRGRLAETVWLGLLREQLYGDIRWNGSKQLRLRRQSALPAFRSYAENTRWNIGQVMFATLHLPAPNNHYLIAAGRNSEFEDRLIANRDWLKRLARHAALERIKAIIVFCDGQVWESTRAPAGARDGFREIRAALRAFADKVAIPVLLVQGPGQIEANDIAPIEWQRNLARTSLRAGVTHLGVDIESETPFSVAGITQSSTEPP